MELLFSLSGLLVMPLWLLMVVLPAWRWTERIVRSSWSVVPAAALYAALVIPRIPALLPPLADPTLPGIAALLATPEGATIGWVHFLAFDLFVGRWAYLDSRRRGISGWLMAPVLLLVLMFGPLGFLVYLALRAAAGGLGARIVGEAGRTMRSAMAVNRPLALLAAAMLPLLAATLVGVALDPREITGAPAWLKPAKFAASISVYAATLLWMLGRVRGRERLVRLIANVTAVGLAAEWVIIATQALRGRASHFNAATPLDSTLLGVMGGVIVVVWGMSLVAAVLLIRQPEADRAFAWSVRLGLVTALVGAAMGGAMTVPTAEQRAAMERGERPVAIGAHAVGVPDGGPGLPAVGWSTTGGDVRVPHFFGLHGMQVIPLLGLLLARVRGLRGGHRVALVWTGGAGYLAFTLILFWQALRGEPVVAPGPATLAALGTLALAIAAAVGAVVAHARARPAPVRGAAPLGA